MIKNIIILVLGYFVWLAYIAEAHAANKENQYCNIETTLVRTVDQNGNTINEKNEEMDKNNNGSILIKFAIFIKIPPPLDEKIIESSNFSLFFKNSA